MELNRAILVLALASAVILSTLPCSAAEKDKSAAEKDKSAAEKEKSAAEKNKEDIWAGDEPRGPRPGPGPGPGLGPGLGPGGPGPGEPGPGRGFRRFELTDEEIDSIMKGLKESDPAKAKELAKLRSKDPEKFRDELREHSREQYGKIIKERIDNWRKKRQEEFLEWLEKSVSKEAQELAKLKERNPDLYAEKFDLVWKKYGRIFEEGRRSPELAEVLLADLELQKRRDELLKKIKTAGNEKEKEKLVAELEEVIGARFDLIVRKKQIAYEQLLKRLEDLQKKVRESRDEIDKWQDEKFKSENVKKHTKDLLEGTPQLRWD
jgi:hypothetical protein